MKYDPNKHHRRSIRLQGYDYSQSGLYFVTICMQNRACLLGEIQMGQIKLNSAGEMIYRWWNALPDKFPSVVIDAFVVMPNHFHGIIVITNNPVGADQCVCPNPPVCPNDDNSDRTRVPGAHTDQGAHAGAPLPKSTDRDGDVGADQCVCPPCVCPNPPVCPNDDNSDRTRIHGTHTDQGAHTGAPLPTMVQWFKTMTTNEYIRGVKNLGWEPFNKRLWQRNYYEHIIRNEESLQHIREYVHTNPLKWEEDQLHPNVPSKW
ncbi:hypothetical protein NIES2119_02235 [[Phormidium ambiguum] IAM M-71]|uniref:Transposase IS200-like domain-containing protein n=1 Tax=[Phormidium ambiguum] IAM M-71 TaxID=454136 RepID=A0A1U7ISI8_9CYAN|nr:transposase [Phormidium ambiguum]OKH40460.1 hypothetical protein NIES2119_02235 [Phormidium ambiguum IAM M-71]